MNMTDIVNAIYKFDIDGCITEFKDGFNSISKLSDPTGVHTFTFSSYNNNKVTTELLFCSIYRKTVIFYSSQLALELSVGYKKPTEESDTEDDNEISDQLDFEILGGEVKPIGGAIIDLLSTENQSEAYYIGRYNKTQNISELTDNLINANIHELNSLILSRDMRDNIVNKAHPDIELIDTKVIDSTYYDIYAVPVNSTFKIQQIDGINTSFNESEVEIIVITSHPDLVYLGDCCNYNGYYYSMYTLNKPEELANAIELLENELNLTDNLIIDESELVDISVDFFHERINAFKLDINKSLEKEEIPTNIDENPFSNTFFDSDRETVQRKPLRMSRRLGEDNK